MSYVLSYDLCLVLCLMTYVSSDVWCHNYALMALVYVLLLRLRLTILWLVWVHCLLSTCHFVLILIPFEEPPHLTADWITTLLYWPNAIDAVQRQCSIEDSVGEWFSFFEGSIVQFRHFEYEMSREFVKGKSWGHEPRPNPYSALFPFFSMLKQVLCQRDPRQHDPSAGQRWLQLLDAVTTTTRNTSVFGAKNGDFLTFLVLHAERNNFWTKARTHLIPPPSSFYAPKEWL